MFTKAAIERGYEPAFEGMSWRPMPSSALSFSQDR